ncbi:hypothetical protein ACFOSC_10700 [Streptantibioticus rubrisoli]|uniref:Uncharacterized protein n=1 Tax=Streptantibioticus rubrisoli TaxID=1387313 RepID=A0ABT1PBQ5_9ACTN|nr:hypothetical protein [Streptantibioticus rubrisoli]MCQ4042771.1 hypothetical protein [Streptantibioticus rubrisoli]
MKIDVVSGSRTALADGKILVGDDTARALGWKAGDSVHASYRDDTKGEVTIGPLPTTCSSTPS